MRQKISICVDDELDNIVNEETQKNGFNLDEFLNTALREKFNIKAGGFN